MKIAIDAFRGVKPRIDPRLLGAQDAQVADNCRLWSGALGAWRKPLSVESAGMNSLLFSERFDNGAWTRAGLTDVQANVTTGPDGVTPIADKLRESAVNSSHYVAQTITKTAVAEYWTGSIGIKAAERGFAFVQMHDGVASAVFAIINLADGSISNTSVGGTFTEPQYRVTADGNGFWRLHLTARTNAGTGLQLYVGPALNANTYIYLGTLNSGVYVYGASLRKSATIGPYRVTEGTAHPTFPQSFYLYKNAYWFVFDDIASVVKGPSGGDTADIVYFTRPSSQPRMTYSPQAEDVALRTQYPRHDYTMGLPVPGNPPLAALAPRSGVITSVTSVVATAGAQATASFGLSSGINDGSPLRLKCTFSVTVNKSTATSGRVVFRIQRTSGLVLGSAELPIRMTAVDPTTQIFTYTLEVDDSGQGTATMPYTFSATVTPDSGVFGAITYNHTGTMIRYTRTRVGSAAHGLVVGDTVDIAGVTGATDVNGTDLEVLEVDTVNTFFVAVDGLGQTYVSGGAWTQAYSDSESAETAYVVTFTSTIGAVTFEGPPSDASNIVVRGETEKTHLSSIPVAAPADGGTYLLTAKRIYRTVVRSDTGANYQFVAEIPLAQATYDDSTRSFELGEVLATTDWIKPAADMQGIIELPDGVLAGFSGKEVCFSVPYFPHAWPLKYRLAVGETILGLVSLNNAVAVITAGPPVIIYGTVPGEMRMERAQVSRPCVSARSIVDMGYAGVYASSNGLVYISAADSTVVTKDVFTQEEWKQINPTSLIGAAYDDRYIGFYTKLDGTRAGFVFDPQDQLASWAPLDFGVDSVWSDPATRDLYVLREEYIARWAAHPTEVYFFRWRSKRFVLPKPINFSHARLQADVYPVDLTMYANLDPNRPDILVQCAQKTVTNGREFVLPSGFRADCFEFELRGRGDGKVKSLRVATSIGELNQVGA